MAGKLPVGQKELLWGKLMEMVKQGKISLKTAAAQLKVSYRQGVRLYRRYRERGDAELIHGSRGKPSNRKTAEDIRSRVIEQYRLRYGDFGPAFAAEKLAEEGGAKTSVSAIRRILMEEGLWQGKRRSREYRSRREPGPHFGEPARFDGSPHAWFESRGPRCCLITMTDDAAKTRLSPFFEDETAAGAGAAAASLPDCHTG
jgi:transposase